MKKLKPVLSLALLAAALLGGAVRAEPEAKPAPDPKQLCPPKMSPCPLKAPIKRRAVQQIIGRMPAAAAPVVAPPLVSIKPTPVQPPAPVPLNSCDAGGCLGADGKRYTPAAGAATLDDKGRLCQRNGVWVQCF
jgi:hypothetical protein